MACLLAAASLLAVAPSASAADVVRPDITYATVDGIDLKLDLYLPTGARLAPLVVYLHGGAWKTGSRKGYGVPMPWELGEFPRFGDLTRAGYAVASVDYRLTGQARWPAQLHDVKAAVRWLRANAATFGLDPGRVAAWGESAGGHLAAMLGVTHDRPGLEGTVGVTGQSSGVQAVVDWFGPTDLLTMDEQALPDGLSQEHDVAGSPESDLLGCVPTTCPDRARSASPVSYVDSSAPPTLSQHGYLDHIVPFGQSVELRGLLNHVGVPAELHTYLTDHEFVGLAPPPWELRRTLIDFLDRTVKTRRYGS
nr:Esterase/lipase [Kibdelosporangium sp. MJ126-NF4]